MANNPTGKNAYNQDLLGWTVGLDEWLNKDASKVRRYWRALEEGSNWWVGKDIVGLWGDNPGVNTRPNSLINGQQLNPMGGSKEKFVPFFASPYSEGDLLRASRAALWYFFGGVSGRGGGPTRNLDLLHPQETQRRDKKTGWSKGAPGGMQDKKRLFYWLMTKAPADRIPFVRGTVRRPIVAGNYYRRADENFNTVQREVQLLREGIATLFSAVPKDITTTHAREAIREARAAESQTGATPRRSTRAKPGYRSESTAYTRSGFVTVTARAITQDNIRNGKGQFSHSYWQAMVKDVNRNMAKAFQDEVVAVMQSQSKGRPATKDLINATQDPRNRYPR